MPQISVIIPIYNLWGLTKNCLQSLADFQDNVDLEVLVINNGSKDVSKDEILSFGKQFWPKNFRVVNLEHNLGFAKACNIGAKLANSELLFFLNNDTLAFQSYLEPILNIFKKQSKVLLAPLLIYKQSNSPSFDAGRVQHMGIAFNPNLAVEHLYNFFPCEHLLVQKQRSFQALSAAALFVEKQFFLDLGAFNEDYVNGFEDIDLCQTALKKQGKLILEPKSVLIHLESRTEGRKDKESANTKLLTKRWSSSIYPDLHKFLLADNYEVYLNSNLDLQFKVNDETEVQMLQKYKNDLSEFYNQLLSEPLWQTGYLYFWNNFAANCSLEACLKLALLENNFYQNTPAMQRLAFYMQKLGEDNKNILMQILQFENFAKDQQKIQTKKELVIEKAQIFNDEFLYNLYASC